MGAVIFWTGCDRKPSHPSSTTGPATRPATGGNAFESRTNVGKARFESRDFPAALEAFEAARRESPNDPAAAFNVALTLMQMPERRGDALDILYQIVSSDPDPAATLYLMGLCHMASGQEHVKDAIAAFEQVVRREPDIPNVRWQLGEAYRLAGDNEKAYDQFKACVKLDPLHESGQNSLRTVALKLGKTDEAERAMNNFLRIRKLRGDDPRPPDAIVKCRLTEVRTPFEPAAPPPAIEVKFVDVTKGSGLAISPASEPTSYRKSCRALPPLAAIVDIDGDARWDLVVCDSNDRPTAYRNMGGLRFERDEQLSSLLSIKAAAILCADFNNDGRRDLFVIGDDRSSLLRRVRFVLRQELGRDLSSGESSPDLFAAADFDGDGRTDLVTLSPSRKLSVFLHTPEGLATRAEDWTSESFESPTAVATADWNGDGRPDLLIGGAGYLKLFLNGDGKSFRAADGWLDSPILSTISAITTVDIDGDRDLDLLVATRDGHPLLLRNDGHGTFKNDSAAAGLPESVANLRQMAAFDINRDGRLDLILATEPESVGPMDHSIVLLADGGGRFKPVDPIDGKIRVQSARITVMKLDPDGKPIRLLLAGNAGATLLDSDTTDPSHPELSGIHVGAAAMADMDGDGRDDLVFADDGGDASSGAPTHGPLLLRTIGPGRWENATLPFGLDRLGPSVFSSIVTGDFSGDNAVDLVFAGPHMRPLLMENSAADRWMRIDDVIASGGLSAAMFDFDVDGDLDVAVANQNGGLSLWRNNGDGSFTDEFADKPDRRCVDTQFDQVATADINGDEAPDIVAVGSPALIPPQSDPAKGIYYQERTQPIRPKPLMLWFNQREGTFAAPVAIPDLEGTRIAINDFNNDGRSDFVVGRDGDAVARVDSQIRAVTSHKGMLVQDIETIDYDNDGWLDLLFADNAGVELFRNMGGSTWEEATYRVGLDKVVPIADFESGRFATADFDGDGDTDILLATAGNGPILLRNDGGNAHRQLKINLTGTKSNRDGIGVTVEARAGSFRTDKLVTHLPIEIGVGDHDRMDSVRTVWTNGIVQHLVNVSVSNDKQLAFVEPTVAAGSCPYLYAWNGERFQFVTDLLGNSPAGLSYARGKFLPSDPTEIVKIGPIADFPPIDGTIVLQATDELREIFYFDEVRLLLADHPADVDVFSNDKIQFPPFNESRVVPLRNMRLPTRVFDDSGCDKTANVTAIDSVFLDCGPPLLPQFRGWLPPHMLTMEFDDLDANAPLVLALTGWLQYGDASVNVAVSQSPSAEVAMPKLEALTPDGRWWPVDAVVGMPAGKTKTIVTDLAGKLPVATQALRITTTFEIRWDRISLYDKAPDDAVRVTSIGAGAADLSFHGFGRIEPRVPKGPYTPDFDAPSPIPHWRRGISGWCTRYGDVRELLTEADDRYVILNGGDAVALRFDATNLPPCPDGWVRDLFFYAVGWDKDMDHNVRAGDAVEPLPYRGMDDQAYGATDAPTPPELQPWTLEFNTRYVPADRFEE